jgi:hypothetical protein
VLSGHARVHGGRARCPPRLTRGLILRRQGQGWHARMRVLFCVRSPLGSPSPSPT